MTNKVISFFVISAHLTPESDEIYALPDKEGYSAHRETYNTLIYYRLRSTLLMNLLRIQ